MKQTDALKILKAGRNVYLTGAAGSGKTHVLNEYITYLKHRGVRVGVTASTGIAATHIGGVTVHSWSGVGIRDALSDSEIEALEQKEYLWKRFDKACVLVIDEVSMLSPRLFDTVERVCRVMKRREEPFGGMQLPPIMRGSARTEFVNVSDAWNGMDIRVCYLEEQFRQKDGTLESILNEIRSGAVSEKTREILNKQRGKNFDKSITPTRLYAHNVDVDVQNDEDLAKLPGKEHTFDMQTKGRANLVESLKKSILAPEGLVLKKDAVVMFVKNSFEEGYVNGTLGVVKDFEKGVPVVETFSGKKIYVHTAEWTVEEDGKILARVEQLPLRLAWAITVHKSQGMSMDAAEIDLSKSFSPGQGYVALSRLRTLAGLELSGINETAFAVHPDVADLDKHLLSESNKWEKVIARFNKKDVDKLHVEFIEKCGGTTDKSEISKNKNKQADNVAERISTYEKTRKLIGKGMSLEEIAKERGMTLGTIIAHLEKLKEREGKIDFKKFKPKSADFKNIKDAFRKTGDTKLTPVYKKLEGKYSYEDLPSAIVFGVR